MIVTATAAVGRFARDIFWLTDAKAIRVLLGVASFGFAAILWYHPEAFDRKGFQAMAFFVNQFELGSSLGAVNVWAVAFCLHGIGVFAWGLEGRGWPAAIVNAWGCFVWTASTWLINTSVGEISPGTSLEITVITAAYVALLRTTPQARLP